MARSHKARKGSTSRYKYCKGPRDSWAYEKQVHSRLVRRDGRAFTRDFYRLNLILFSGYPMVDEVMEEVRVNKRPWID